MDRPGTEIAGSDATGDAGRARSIVCEALAARVREATASALTAFHAAEADRRAFRAIEPGEACGDTLDGIEEAADALHGFASWALSGAPHPDRANVLQTLHRLQWPTRFDVRAKLLNHCVALEKLWAYVGRLGDLQAALLAYFEQDVRIPDCTTAKKAR